MALNSNILLFMIPWVNWVVLMLFFPRIAYAAVLSRRGSQFLSSVRIAWRAGHFSPCGFSSKTCSMTVLGVQECKRIRCSSSQYFSQELGQHHFHHILLAQGNYKVNLHLMLEDTVQVQEFRMRCFIGGYFCSDLTLRTFERQTSLSFL